LQLIYLYLSEPIEVAISAAPERKESVEKEAEPVKEDSERRVQQVEEPFGSPEPRSPIRTKYDII